MECMMVMLFLASRTYRERAKILIAFLVWLEMMDSALNRCRKSPTDQSIVIDLLCGMHCRYLFRPRLEQRKSVGILEDRIPIEKIPIVPFGTKE
jgi:hypothetical protein